MATSKPLYVLGLCYFGQHDSAVALLKDGVPVTMRASPDRAFPREAIEQCLSEAGISINEIAHAAFFWQPWRGVLPRMLYALKGLPKSLGTSTKNAGVLFDLLRAQRTFRRETGYRGPFHHVPHPLAHAAHTFFSSGFEKAAILTADGTGENSTCWLGKGDGTTLTEYGTVSWPHSLGHMYSAVTEYLGYTSFKDEGTVMELSKRGAPTHLDAFRQIIKSTGSGLFTIDLRYVDYQYSREPRYSPFFAKEFASVAKENIAASLQVRLEEVLLEIARHILASTGERDLCLAGGLMHNTLAVEKLRQSGIARQIYVPEHPGDIGTALGAALYIHTTAVYIPAETTRRELTSL